MILTLKRFNDSILTISAFSFLARFVPDLQAILNILMMTDLILFLKDWL